MNDDLINRQAVIDAIERAVTKEVARRSVKELPSAHPEVIRCKDCKYYTSVTAQCEIRGKGLYLIRGLNDFCSKAERRTDE